ncbi:MAG: hypothetical protein AAGG08_18570, partial [Actinomycetota bacterium]
MTSTDDRFAPSSGGRGPSFLVLLVGLALLPLFGGTLIGIDQYREVRDTRATVDDVLEMVVEVTDLDEVRLAVVDENNFFSAVAGVQDIGIPVELVSELTGFDLIAEYERARGHLDALLEAAAAPDVADAVEDIRQQGFDDVDGGIAAYDRVAADLELMSIDRRAELEARAATMPSGAELVQALTLSEIAATARSQFSDQLWTYFLAQFSPLDETSDNVIGLAAQRDRVERALGEIERTAAPGSPLGDAVIAVSVASEVTDFRNAVDATIDGVFRPEDTERDLEVDVIEQAALSADIYRAAASSIVYFDAVIDESLALVDETSAIVRDAAAEQFRATISTLAITALLSLGVAIALARYVGVPMRRLTSAAARIGDGADVDVGRHG